MTADGKRSITRHLAASRPTLRPSWWLRSSNEMATRAVASDIYGGLIDADNALERSKISGTAAVGSRYFNAA